MKIMSLKEFAADKGQQEAANLLGVRQGSICKAVLAEREIYVEEKDGKYRAYEVRDFPARK